MTTRRLSTTIALAVFGLCFLPGSAPTATASAVPVPDAGWRLLLDDQAKWQDDPLYLPDEVDLPSMPINPPSGGWAALGAQAGIAVSLPSTVEEHYWGKPPAACSERQSAGRHRERAGQLLGRFVVVPSLHGSDTPARRTSCLFVPGRADARRSLCQRKARRLRPDRRDSVHRRRDERAEPRRT